MCANHPIDPGDMLAPIPTAVPPEAEEPFNTETQRHGDAEAERRETVDDVIAAIRRKEKELWGSGEAGFGTGAAALMLDGFASRLEIAAGLCPPPRVHFTPDAVPQNPPFAAESPEPMSRVEAIQILSRGLALADRRTRSAHLMAIHALAKRAAEAERRARRKAAAGEEGARHD